MELYNVAIFVLFLSVVSVFTVSDGKDALVGGWTPIKNVKDPQVVEIAKFAVTEYGKQSGSKLSFVKVIKGETQVVSGTNYRLVLAAKVVSATKNYEALVWEKPWLHLKNLTSFKPVA
uniref:Cystatin domain-containing protein n=1 Tax=Medicago truncatula TaxID=3880 RepID=I3SSB0_MEDTR|nr:unknown [Medicago truncatula]